VSAAGREARPRSGRRAVALDAARLQQAVYVLHTFQKKTQATSKRDLQLAKNRYAELIRGHR
jgi:phage-related protein